MLSEQQSRQRSKSLSRSKSSILSSKPTKFHSIRRGTPGSLSDNASSVTTVSTAASDLTVAETATALTDEDSATEVDTSEKPRYESEKKVIGEEGEEKEEVDGETESLVRFLIHGECGLPLLLDRVKQNMNSCKETISFLKKRAAIEEEYAKNLIKLVQGTNEHIEKGESKRGSFIESLKQIVQLHEDIAENRLKFSMMITDVTDDLNTAYKDTERSRKQLKESGEKHEKHLSHSEIALEKARVKYESSSESWEKAIQLKEVGLGGNGHQPSGRGLSKSMSGSIGLFNQAKKPEKLVKDEEFSRHKTSTANEGYKTQLALTNQVRADFYQLHLPRILKSLKETNDTCDAALQYHLSKYAYLLEQTMMTDATTICPLNNAAKGIRGIVEQINNKQDLKEYVMSYIIKNSKLNHSDIKQNEYGMPASSQDHSPPTFGVELAVLLERDNAEVPHLLRSCFGLVEEFGMDTVGLYRSTPSNQTIEKFKNSIQKDSSFSLRTEEIMGDLSILAGLVKLFFRELPDPLFTRVMYREFISACKMDDERMRLLTIHDLVNRLPDPNYATLRFLMCHLDRIAQNQHRNNTNVQGLSILFGPILLSAPDGIDTTNDLYFQCKAVEIILKNFRIIFDTDE